MGKGQDYERKLANTLDDAGWGVVRAGGSGGGTDDDRPDILAGDGDYVWAIEAKFSSDRNIYLTPAEVDALQRFAANLNAEAVAAARWNTRAVDACDTADWFMAPLSLLPTTDGGNYALRVDDITDRYKPLSAYL